jgi:class 3 adenylate cyclase
MIDVGEEVRYARSGELNIAYRVLGEGPLDLVWVPNWLSNVDLWGEEQRFARFFDRLASFARVIVFDRRGSGLSDPVVGAPTLEERMEDIRTVMEGAQSERAAIVGFSEGVPMAALFAATFPERSSALVLYAGYARTMVSDDYPWAPATGDGRWRCMISQWGTGRNVAWFAPSMVDDPAFVAWWARFERSAASPGSVRQILRLNAEIDVRDVLSAIQVPTLVLHREGDRTIEVGNGRYLAEQIPDARLVEVPGDDHVPMVGDQDALLDEIEEFLTGARSIRETERVLATVMFTDLSRSTELAGSLGDRRWRSLLERHDAAVRREVERCRGQAIKSLGDGVLATFDGPARAIRCALAIRERLRPLGLELRAGLHTGEIETIENDVSGIAVHITARVLESARPGEILASSTVRDLVVGSGLAFEDRGTHELRGVPGEWRLHAVVE